MTHYFAYGSNMDPSQMVERCPDSTLVTPGALHGYRLAFSIFSTSRECGCADIILHPGSSVHGLVYSVSDKDLERLDICEGVAEGAYRRIKVEIETAQGTIPCEAYEVVTKEEPQQPSVHYLGILKSAARKYAFPRPYCEFLDSVATRDSGKSLRRSDEARVVEF